MPSVRRWYEPLVVEPESVAVVQAFYCGGPAVVKGGAMNSASGSEEERLNKNLTFMLVQACLGIVGIVLTSLCGGLAGFLLG